LIPAATCIEAACERGFALYTGVPDELPRPDIEPAQVAQRFRAWLQERSMA
jgi:hypothetical protein